MNSPGSGASAGIGTYGGGAFEVYGSEGFYLTSDWTTTIYSQELITIKTDNISMETTSGEKYLTFDNSSTSDELIISSETGLLTLSVINNLDFKYDNELRFNDHLIDFPFNSGSFDYTFPTKSGTIALTSDIPSVPNITISSSLSVRVQELTLEGGSNTGFYIGDCKYVKIIPFEANMEEEGRVELTISPDPNGSNAITIPNISKTNCLFPVEISINYADEPFTYYMDIKYSYLSVNSEYITKHKSYMKTSSSTFTNLYLGFNDVDTAYIKVLMITIEK